jgi:hypothetical protein
MWSTIHIAILAVLATPALCAPQGGGVQYVDPNDGPQLPSVWLYWRKSLLLEKGHTITIQTIRASKPIVQRPISTWNALAAKNQAGRVSGSIKILVQKGTEPDARMPMRRRIVRATLVVYR